MKIKRVKYASDKKFCELSRMYDDAGNSIVSGVFVAECLRYSGHKSTQKCYVFYNIYRLRSSGKAEIECYLYDTDNFSREAEQEAAIRFSRGLVGNISFID
jgi:hypothetical protein